MTDKVYQEYMVKANQILLHAEEILKRGWCQGTMAQRKNSTPCNIHDAGLDKVCIFGSVVKSGIDFDFSIKDRTSTESNPYTMAVELVMVEVNETNGKLISPSVWNDKPERTKEEVVGVLHRAAIRAERLAK